MLVGSFPFRHFALKPLSMYCLGQNPELSDVKDKIYPLFIISEGIRTAHPRTAVDPTVGTSLNGVLVHTAVAATSA